MRVDEVRFERDRVADCFHLRAACRRGDAGVRKACPFAGEDAKLKKYGKPIENGIKDF